MKGDTPLYDAVCAHASRSKVRLHMPAHAGVGDGSDLYASARYDLTELEDTDNLLQGQDVILRAEEEFARVYGVKRALMLTGGGTVGMQIALGTVGMTCKEVAVVGGMHKSFWNACALLGLRVTLCATPAEVKAAAARNPAIKAVVVTSPDYYGVCADMAELRSIADACGATLIADAAHGAHFAFSSRLPVGAERYADLTVTSMHKTLPVYGGGALLLIGNGPYAPREEDALYWRQMMHSTSPNYLVMASMDYARALTEASGEAAYARTIEEIARPRKWGGMRVVPSDDPTRLVLCREQADCTALASMLHRSGIDVEMAYGDRLVCIVTPYSVDGLDLLNAQLNRMDIPQAVSVRYPHDGGSFVSGSGKVTFCPLSEAEGKISAAEIGVYPPGVPVVHIGQTIEKRTLEFLIGSNSCLFGLVNGKVAVLQ